jgi:TM2 domain-containing membrane protein YozV
METVKPASDYGPLIALILSFVGGLYGFPGLGQIFNGQVVKGIVLSGAVILVWLVLVAIILLTWGLGIFVCFPLAFVPMLIQLYAIVDAYITGKRKQGGERVRDWL